MSGPGVSASTIEAIVRWQARAGWERNRRARADSFGCRESSGSPGSGTCLRCHPARAGAQQGAAVEGPRIERRRRRRDRVPSVQRKSADFERSSRPTPPERRGSPPAWRRSSAIRSSRALSSSSWSPAFFLVFPHVDFWFSDPLLRFGAPASPWAACRPSRPPPYRRGTGAARRSPPARLGDPEARPPEPPEPDRAARRGLHADHAHRRAGPPRQRHPQGSLGPAASGHGRLFRGHRSLRRHLAGHRLLHVQLLLRLWRSVLGLLAAHARRHRPAGLAAGRAPRPHRHRRAAVVQPHRHGRALSSPTCSSPGA